MSSFERAVSVCLHRLNWQPVLLQSGLKQCTGRISDCLFLIPTQRHCSEQDGPDEQVTVVKQICKLDTIALRVMVCLCIGRVIVPLQLGYLHNQLSDLATLCFPLFAPFSPLFSLITIGTLPYTASCSRVASARMRELVLLCQTAGWIEST